MKISRILLVLALLMPLMATAAPRNGRWSEEKANQWYYSQPWAVGCDYIVSNAINQIEMWQESTFSPELIDKELAMAEDLGFNTVRLFLHDLVYAADPKGFKSRVSQVLDICEMKDPTMCLRSRTIARAELEWELVEPYVGTSAILEGAFFLENNGRLFIIYSANGCWSNHYALGVLEFTGDDLCDPESWTKHPEPLLVYGNGVYGPGHASFFRSPDGSEVWCCYHGMPHSNESVTYTNRYMHIQKVEFDETGFPVMGMPIGCETPIDPPSGERK